jgi:hypothetical protein
VRAALLSLVETVPGASALRGAVPLANGQLAMAQIDLAQMAGAGEILCLVSPCPFGARYQRAAGE